LTGFGLRSTGIPKIREAMRRNGSPPPVFETDDERTYFLVRLPLHPAMIEAHDEAPVQLSDTERRVLRALEGGARSVPEIAASLNYQNRSGHLKRALERLDRLGLIALTLPGKPRSKNQKRTLTVKGRRMLEGGTSQT